MVHSLKFKLHNSFKINAINTWNLINGYYTQVLKPN
jgi:hypothetical protein